MSSDAKLKFRVSWDLRQSCPQQGQGTLPPGSVKNWKSEEW